MGGNIAVGIFIVPCETLSTVYLIYPIFLLTNEEVTPPPTSFSLPVSIYISKADIAEL